MDTNDLRHLERCVELATQALEAGDEPFGSVLVDGAGPVCFEDRNRVASGDRTRHPEFALARWAAANMSPAEKAASTVYTSGEHCPMCAAAHGWVGLGRIVYATSSAQLTTWLAELGVAPPPVATLPIEDVVPGGRRRTGGRARRPRAGAPSSLARRKWVSLGVIPRDAVPWTDIHLLPALPRLRHRIPTTSSHPVDHSHGLSRGEGGCLSPC